MASRITIWYLIKGHYRKTRTIDRGRSSSQTEAIAIIPTTTLVEGRASCRDSAVWVGMCPTQALRGIRRQDRVVSPFTRSIRINLPRIPNLVWVGWSSIMARASPSGTRGRGCSAEVMVAYLRDSLDTAPKIAEEGQRSLTKVEELTTRVAISTQHLVALIRSRRTWESWTLVYLPRYS